MKREDLSQEIIKITETIGCQIADLEDLIEAIHYNPEAIDEEDFEGLIKINGMLDIALRAASAEA